MKERLRSGHQKHVVVVLHCVLWQDLNEGLEILVDCENVLF